MKKVLICVLLTITSTVFGADTASNATPANVKADGKVSVEPSGVMGEKKVAITIYGEAAKNIFANLPDAFEKIGATTLREGDGVTCNRYDANFPTQGLEERFACFLLIDTHGNTSGLNTRSWR